MSAKPLQALEGKYEIIDKMSEGGMGAVYKVRHRLLDEVRVVKVMRPGLASDDVFRERFLREARVAIKLRHPNLAQIYDFTISDDGQAFLIMEFIDGLTLHHLLRVSGPPSLAMAVEIVTQALDVIGYLHQRQVVHRDVSPDNLMLALTEDRRPVVKLLDLGIATVEGGKALTTEGVFLGKVRYSSPEHFKTGEGVKVDARSDLYCMGVVAYELLTGSHPVAATDTAALIAGHLVTPPRPFQDTDPEDRIPESVRQVVVTALAKRPEDRFVDAAAMAAALRNALPADLERASSDEIRHLFEAAPEATIDLHRPRPGSTQDRLDRSFLLEPTPADHAPGRPEALPSESETSSGDATVDRRLADARDLRDRHLHDEAIAILQEIIHAHPDHVTARELLGAVRDDLERDRAERRRQQEVADSVASIRSDLESDRLDEAERALRLARKVCGEHQVFTDLGTEIAARRDALRRREAEQALARARTALAEADWEIAASWLDTAHAADAGVPGIEDLARELADAKADAEREAQRREACRRAVDRVERLLRIDRLDAATRALDGALQEVGDFDEAGPLRERIEAAVRERREVESRGWTLLEEARTHAEADRLDAARTVLESARALEERAPDLANLAVEVEEDLRHRYERSRRRTAVEEASASVTAHLDGGDLDRADRELSVAERLYPEDDRLDTLRERVAAARRQEVARRETERLATAERGEVDLTEVIGSLQDLVADDPRNHACRTLLDRARILARRRRLENVSRDAAEVVATVERAVADGDLDAAAAVLSTAGSEVAARPDIRRLRERLGALLEPPHDPSG